MKRGAFILVGTLAVLALATGAWLKRPAVVEAINLHSARQRIEIRKAMRELSFYENGKLVKTYRIGLGGKPVGPKIRQGDKATPEGDYLICSKNPRSKYYLSLGISYPGPEDAKRGLREKLISRSQHDAIIEASKKRRTPPWDTPLGGEIFIHGRGSGSDWTLGCIALDDADMKELFGKVRVGASVRIEP